MPSASPKLPGFPPPNFPVLDPKTGLMTTVWYEYFRALDLVLRTVREEIP